MRLSRDTSVDVERGLRLASGEKDHAFSHFDAAEVSNETSARRRLSYDRNH